MNLILLTSADFIAPERAVIRDQRRLQHIQQIQRVALHDELKVGLLNDKIGTGKIIALTENEIQLDVTLIHAPPVALPLRLILALPRPKMLKRVIQTAATLGVKELILINSYRVEKSYWQTPLLEGEKIHEHLILGLEQAGDTQLPLVRLATRFKPFVEDELPDLIRGSRALVAHPYTDTPCPRMLSEKITLAVGPEGGFIPYEIDLLMKAGFEAVHLGERIMRVETAIPFILSRLF